jgi:hypothetical protein
MRKKLFSRRPSAATVIAVIALIAALAGTAVAGGGFVSNKKFKNYKRNTNASLAQTVKGPLNYVSATVSITPNTGAGSVGTDVAVACPAGTAPTGGGIKLSNDSVEFVNDSHPTIPGWAGTVFNAGTATHSATVTAICATAATTGSRPSS